MTDTYSLKAPNVGVTGKGTLDLRTAQFGEGYAQDASAGPNNESQSWPLTWTLVHTDAIALMAFIRAHAQGQRFYWTPPLGVQGYYVITDYTVNALGGDTTKGEDVYTITATFVQRFGP